MAAIDDPGTGASLAGPVTWRTEPSPPLDLDGPHQVAFRRFEDSWVERPALELFADAVTRHAPRIACQDVDSALSFAEIWASARRLAETIDASIPAGGAVGVLLPNQASYPVAVLACLGAARPAVLIDRHYPAERVAAIVRDAGCAGMIMNDADIAGGYLLPAGVRPLPLQDALSGVIPGSMPAQSPPNDAPTFIVYTSGSTGRPKGIVLSQRSVLHRAAELVNAVHLNPEDKVLSLASPGTIGGLQQIFEVLLSGASLVKLDLQRLGLGQVVRTIAERQISMMFSTPAVWRSVSRLAGAKEMLASLRCIQSSGDTLLRVDYELIRGVIASDCHVLSVYGATEAPALLQWFVAGPPREEARVPAGRPLPGVEFAVLDERDKPAAEGEPGELVIRSRFTSLGQWQRGTVVPGALAQDPQARGLRIYRTGDLVRKRPDGLYVVLGRRDRQIKILGNRVELAEIETALRQAPNVLDGAVVARRGEVEPRLYGFVVPGRVDDPGIVDEVRRHLEAVLPSYMRPHGLLALDALPLLPGRKIDEEALLARAEPVLERAADTARHVGSRSASPQARAMVDTAWRLALGRPPPQTALSFEAAGGDSLQLLQLVFELERLVERPLALEKFHARLSLEEIARQLEESLEQAAEVLPAEAPAVFLFPPAGGGDAYLTAFRAACAPQFLLRQVRYPDLRALAQPQASFREIAADAVRQIEALKPAGPLTLAGYSDGGDVACEAARQLSERGRTVARLLILDTDASGLSYPPPRTDEVHSQAPIFVRYLRRPTDRHYRRLVQKMVPGRSLLTPAGRILLRLALALPVRLPSRIAFIAGHKVYAILFDDHHRKWSALEAPPLDVPAVLFHSQERRPGAPADLGWRDRTPNLTITPVPGDHSTMLEGDRGAALAQQFARLAAEGASHRP